MKASQLVLIFIFCAIIGGCTAVSLLKPETEFSETENRVLETMPDINAEDVLYGVFQDDYENYLNDQFFLRDTFVDVAVAGNRAVGKNDVNCVFIGKDDYLLEKYTDGFFNAELREQNVECLSGFISDMADRYGTDRVTVLFVPAKTNVLTDKLPAYAPAYDEAALLNEIREQLKEPSCLLDVTSALAAHKDEYIYYRTDHHWTGLGAYYGYEAWAAKTGEKPAALADYRIEQVDDKFYGTTYNKVHIKVTPDVVTLYRNELTDAAHVTQDEGGVDCDGLYYMDALAELDKYRVFLGGNTAEIVIDTGLHTGKTLLLLKDSYANCFVPYLANHYDRILMLDMRYCSDSVYTVLAEHEEVTDVLAMFNVEEFLQTYGFDKLEREFE